MADKLRISFGALSKPLHEQLSEFDLTEEDLEWEQKLADAVTLCHIHNIITEAEKNKARRRLMKRLVKKVESHTGTE